MDQSRRAVESYWRSRMIDGATSDEDKVTPVYKLEEICELLRSSHVSIVKEVSEFVLKRLQNKSPIVKQKALRVIKYAVGKSGTEFRREMQRNSVAVRQLIHYKGQPDPLKGDSLNKAVREMAQEALSAIFASEDSKPSPAENLGGRIQGFGNTNYEMPSDDRKSSFLTEVVNIGSTTIKQGFSSLTHSPSLKKNDTGSYRGPNLRRSLTMESEFVDQYEGFSSHGDSQKISRLSKNGGSVNWGQDVRLSQSETTNGDSSSSYGEKTHEERLLETIVTSGGVRLQPTRDALQAFLLEASKLDALALSNALESKLLSPLWQVRMKAVCVLEAILRKKDDEQFSVVALYFSENRDVVVKCSESPQASLREKANKVLSLLDGEQTGSGLGHQEKTLKAEATTVQMPDLIDTGDPDDIFGMEESVKTQNDQSTAKPSTSATPLIDDLFGGGLNTGLSTSEQNDDPFADVSFLNSNNSKEPEPDIFSGMTVDKSGATEPRVAGTNSGPQLFDIFGFNSEVSEGVDNPKRDVNDLMANLSVSETGSAAKQNVISSGVLSENLFSESPANPGHKVPSDAFNNILASQATGVNANPMFPMGAMPYSLPPGFMFNPSLAAQPMNYNVMGSLLAQQQFLATMSNFQQLGNLQPDYGGLQSAGSNAAYSSPIPDVFNPTAPNQGPTSMMSSSKKEETRAFDFISDHLAAARDPKRVV